MKNITVILPDEIAGRVEQKAKILGITRHKGMVQAADLWADAPIPKTPKGVDSTTWPMTERYFQCPACSRDEHCNLQFREILVDKNDRTRELWICRCEECIAEFQEA